VPEQEGSSLISQAIVTPTLYKGGISQEQLTVQKSWCITQNIELVKFYNCIKYNFHCGVCVSECRKK
jgi:hypothetical protein